MTTARPRLRSRLRKTVIRGWSSLLAGVLATTPRRSLAWKPPRSILIVRLHTLGESLLVFPMVRALKVMIPGVRVEVLTRNVELWSMCPGVDAVRRFRFSGALFDALREYRTYDVVFDTEPYGEYSAVLARLWGKCAVGFRTGNRERLYDQALPFNDQQYEAQTFLDLLQPVCGPALFEGLVAPEVTSGEGTKGQGLPDLDPDRLKIAVNLGSSLGAPQRQWPLERHAELLRRLSEAYRCQVIFVGQRLERDLVTRITPLLPGVDVRDTTDTLSVRQLARLLANVDGLLSADTGTMHLGAAMGIPVFSLFGPNLPIRFAPRNADSEFFYHPTAPSPCINVHLAPANVPCPCNGDCLRQITVEEVLRVMGQWAERKTHGKNSPVNAGHQVAGASGVKHHAHS